MINSLSGRAAI